MCVKRKTVVVSVVFAVLCALVPAGLAAGSLGKTHLDKEVGFSIRVPRDWEFVASPDSERYIVAKFVCERELWSRTAGKFRHAHTPEMRIIAFTPENRQIVENNQEQKKVLGRTVTVIASQNPYRDFREYTKRNQSGFYFGDEKKGKVRGIDCTWLEVVMEQKRPPMRQLVCIYHLEDMDIAVTFEIMDEWFSKYERLFRSSLKTFKKVKRTVSKESSARSLDEKPKSRNAFVRSVTSKLPKGWIWKETKNFLVISHTKKKFTDTMAAYAESIHKVMARDYRGRMITAGNGPGAANDDDVTLPIIRICADLAERNAYVDNSGGNSLFNSDTGEIVIFNGLKEGLSTERIMQKLASGIHELFLVEKFGWMTPHPWYTAGMGYYYSCFKGTGSRCKYSKQTRDIEELRKAVRGGDCRDFEAMIFEETMHLTYKERIKLGTLFCFLKSREGSGKMWKGLAGIYLDNFQDVYREISGNSNRNIESYSNSKTTSSGRDEKSGSDVKDSIVVDFKEVRKEARARTFSGWTDKDWEKLETAWKKWVL